MQGINPSPQSDKEIICRYKIIISSFYFFYYMHPDNRIAMMQVTDQILPEKLSDEA